jgi:hypothetical protein
MDCTAAPWKTQRDAAELLLDSAANKKADKKKLTLTTGTTLFDKILIDWYHDMPFNYFFFK